MTTATTPELAALNREVEAGKNVFIAGRAGTGKSTALRAIREAAEEQGRIVVALAPTGVAAQNVGGMTIHKFFRFPITVLDVDDHEAAAWNPRNFVNRHIMGKLDILIIDEISMVRVDLLHAVDEVMRIVRGRHNKAMEHVPFGGAQVLLFGDPYQLPPVTREPEVQTYLKHRFGSDFFFCAPACGREFQVVELTHVFRQRDEDLRAILNGIREGYVTDAQLDRLNQQVAAPHDDSVQLVPTRARAAEINAVKLAALGVDIANVDAIVNNCKESDSPVDFRLDLAIGARVMMCVNHQRGRYFNGQTGIVKSIEVAERSIKQGAAPKQTIVVEVDINGDVVEVVPHVWERYEYALAGDGKLTKKIVGTIEQLPMRLAWAVTVHKAQGLTLEKVHVDLGGGAFASGQTYVALSRSTGWDGLTLERPIVRSDVMVDPMVSWFRKRFVNAVHTSVYNELTNDLESATV